MVRFKTAFLSSSSFPLINRERWRNERSECWVHTHTHAHSIIGTHCSQYTIYNATMGKRMQFKYDYLGCCRMFAYFFVAKFTYNAKWAHSCSNVCIQRLLSDLNSMAAIEMHENRLNAPENNSKREKYVKQQYNENTLYSSTALINCFIIFCHFFVSLADSVFGTHWN